VFVHAVMIGALVFLLKAVPGMRLPEAVYSVKILQPLVGSMRATGAEESKTVKETPKVEETKKKEPEKREAKIPVPKKPDKAKTEAKPKEAKAGEKEEKPLGLSVGSATADGTGIAVDAANFPFSYFLSAIERKVSGNWFSALTENATALSCVVYFRLTRDGAVEDVRVETTSGNSYFDRAAVRAVKSSAPFPPLPKAFPDEYLGIHFTFVQKE
jgi:TolA protein